MISNYIKLALRVLGRKKFFTVISLFGISFVYDTTYDYEKRGTMMWNSSINNGIGEDYLQDMETIENLTIFNDGGLYDIYVNGVKQTFATMYSDPEYFEVFDHKIIEGRAMDENDFQKARQVVVMSTKAAQNYFGRTSNVVGEEMEIDEKMYKVIGLYPHNGRVREFVSPHLVLPYTLLNEEDQTSFYHGSFSVILQKQSSVDVQVAKEELKERADKIPMDHPTKPEGYNELLLNGETYDEMIASGVMYLDDSEKSYRYLKYILLFLLSFFIVLPTLNLINLNVSRIMDRSSEIGVRKAFGAHQGNILGQFVVENIIQTIIGGAIGLGLAVALINLINKGGALGESSLSLSPKFFLWSLIITLIFGVISGALPAYRMSKLQIVSALKNNKL